MIDRLSVRRGVYDLHSDLVDSIAMGDALDLWEHPDDRTAAIAEADNARSAFLLLGGSPHDVDHLPERAARRYAHL